MIHKQLYSQHYTSKAAVDLISDTIILDLFLVQFRLIPHDSQPAYIEFSRHLLETTEPAVLQQETV